MKSKYADYFNHDDDAPEYDEDVVHECNPIRTGYSATLQWVAHSANIRPLSRVLELGSGTGNLTQILPFCKEIVCVDISQQMESHALCKLNSNQKKRFINEDILAVFDQPLGSFSSIISTYTVHHLTESEKEILFQQIWEHLEPDGCVVFGDLMLENKAVKEAKIEAYSDNGHVSTAVAIQEEFFWYLDTAIENLETLGFKVTVERFSDLSFGIIGEK